MSSFEELFGSSVLNVIIPDTSLEYPPQDSADDWLARVDAGFADRRQVFFDEQLQSLLIVRISHPPSESAADPNHPPQDLLAFLAHLEVSLEATYISSVPTIDASRSARLSAPPRNVSLGKPNPRLSPQHPSIFPPNTPNPTPSSAEHDRRYVTSEGTLLLASIWGKNTSDDSREAFTLLWSDAEQVWVAIYRLGFTVSFLRLNVANPLLCLTVSTTLREKPLALASPKHPFAVFFASVGGQTSSIVPPSPTIVNGRSGGEVLVDELHGLEEVNLLEGLFAGPTFYTNTSETPRMSLPSTRLGTVSRHHLFSLPPVAANNQSLPSQSPTSASRASHPTLRKSFRKTLPTVSGFRVRMRTVFVPYVLLPDLSDPNVDNDEDEDERERREAGGDERTVVLCVEVENSGDSGSGVGFAVEKVDVSVGGEGAKATLIGWGDKGFSKEAESSTFPLFLESMAQYNLLYAVSFLRSPGEVDGFPISGGSNISEVATASSNADLQRAVAINILGKPYLQLQPLLSESQTNDQEALSYPTDTFSSRWNCILDLSARQNRSLDILAVADPSDPSSMHPSVLPEPASPFPAFTPRTSRPGSPSPVVQQPMIAGGKRHTLPGASKAGSQARKPVPAANYRASTSMLNPANSREKEASHLHGPARLSYMPPSITYQIPRSPTTYEAPPPHPDFIDRSSQSSPDQTSPITPAYPAYPSAAPPTPISQGPINPHSSVGPSVDIRRERGMVQSANGSPIAQSPGPSIVDGVQEQVHLQNAEESGESIVVSVGLLPVANKKGREDVMLGPGKIYPFDSFTLDIFVFNRSTWNRRFEVSCPDRRRRRRGAHSEAAADKLGIPGILPMDHRVRIGPLRPSACQSVRMEFLALVPGVHSVDTLTLTDIESGYSMNLRSVMDIVVHDPSS